MSRYQFHDDSGAPIDSHFEVQSGELTLLSRGGTIGSANARNTQYGPALRLLLERIDRSELTITGVWVDSTLARKLPIEQRTIFFWTIPKNTRRCCPRRYQVGWQRWVDPRRPDTARAIPPRDCGLPLQKGSPTIASRALRVGATRTPHQLKPLVCRQPRLTKLLRTTSGARWNGLLLEKSAIHLANPRITT